MPETDPNTGPKPKDANQRNEREASEADKSTVEQVQKHQTHKEKSKGEFRSGS